MERFCSFLKFMNIKWAPLLLKIIFINLPLTSIFYPLQTKYRENTIFKKYFYDNPLEVKEVEINTLNSQNEFTPDVFPGQCSISLKGTRLMQAITIYLLVHFYPD